jgi:hypothetical protein
MWHAINHDALAMIDTWNAASTAEDNCGFARAIVDHEFYGWHTTAWLDAHAFNFARKFCASATLRVGDTDEVILFESFTETF